MLSTAWQFIVEPLTGSTEQIFIQYVVLAIVGVAVQSVFHVIHKRYLYEFPSIFEMFTYENLIVLGVIVFPIFEELVFRGLPSLFLSGQVEIWGMILSGGVWVAAHGRRGAIFALFAGVILSKLWLAGMWEIAILLHIAHNGLMIGGFMVYRELLAYFSIRAEK